MSLPAASRGILATVLRLRNASERECGAGDLFAACDRLPYTRNTGRAGGGAMPMVDVGAAGDPRSGPAASDSAVSGHANATRNAGDIHDPRPTIDIRAILFTVADGALLVALGRHNDGWGLPRGDPSPSDTLDAAARRIVREGTGLQEQYLEQLYTLSVRAAPEWTIIVGYMALVCSGQAPAPPLAGSWHDVAALPQLSHADQMVIDYALVRLRAKLGYTNIAFHLLPQTFTLSELQGAYEAILSRRLDKRNFRRRVIASGILSPTPEKRRDGSHRPAVLYRFRADENRETYLTPPWAEGT